MPSTVPAPGDVVRIRDRRWRVLRAATEPPVTTLTVASLDSPSEQRASFLLPFEPCDALPFDERPLRVSRPRWRRVVRRVLADAVPGWPALRTPAAADVSLLPFQLAPALALFHGHGQRLLIADAVGLGKTIQAGIIIGETLARLPHARALIVTPAGLREQWAQELSDRLALTSRIVDAADLQRAVRVLPPGTNPWNSEPIAITSIDFVKRPDVMRALEGLIWDVVVFDEAHALCGRSDRAAAAEALGERARVVVLLTATPHPGEEGPFNRLQRIGSLADARPPIVFRRTRDEIGAARRRRSSWLQVRPTAAEAAMHRALSSYAAAARDSDLPGAHLAIAVLQRRAASSPTSLAASARRRIELLAGVPAAQEPPQLSLPFASSDGNDDAPEVELSAPALLDRDLELRHLEAIASLAGAASHAESKIATLARLLRRIGEPAIVFTEYRDTLRTVATALGVASVALHGGLAASERRAAMAAFTSGNARLLLATDAASEGLNLHRRCRLVINLELPWSSIRLEQRIGRVDRLGQARTVHAVQLVASGTVESDIRRRLDERHERAESVATTAPVHLTGEAMAECQRIAIVRGLTSRAASIRSSRAVVTVARGRWPARVAAYAVRVVDARGDLLWESLVGLDATITDVQPLARILGERAQAELLSFVRTMQAREEQIRDALHRHGARLSARLLQPGLFDRRAERQASAQRLLLADAEARCKGRAVLLEALSAARATIGPLAFAISPRQW